MPSKSIPPTRPADNCLNTNTENEQANLPKQNFVLTEKEAKAAIPTDMSVGGEEDPGEGSEFLVTDYTNHDQTNERNSTMPSIEEQDYEHANERGNGPRARMEGGDQTDDLFINDPDTREKELEGNKHQQMKSGLTK